jgi:dipeptidyl aminopeptidase/acylaminoacyl peptidase
MGIRRRTVLFAALAVFGAGHAAPASALPAPLTLVAGRADGAFVRVTVDVTGAVTGQHVLLRPDEHVQRATAQVRPGVVSVAEWRSGTGPRPGRSDSLLLDPRTGKVLDRRADGATGQWLVSPDGRSRYVVLGNTVGGLSGVIRTDAAGRRTKTLLAPAGAAELSGAALSPDGRTLYLARTTDLDKPSILYAIDTATAARREVTYLSPFTTVTNTVVSPDGATLAVSFFDSTTFTFKSTVIDVAGGVARPVALPADAIVSAFTPGGDRLVLSVFDPEYRSSLAVADLATLVVVPLRGSTDLLAAMPVP